jgi:murein DD-endopeptidase MepM/ murein hydrolase activator NlpD
MRVLPLLALALVTTIAGAQTPALDVRAAARAMQPGEVVRLTITAPADVDSLLVSAFDRSFPAFRTDAETWQVLVGIDLDIRPGTHVVAVTTTGGEGVRTTTRRLSVLSKTFRTRRLTVEPKYVEPPASVSERIASEAKRLDAIWTARTSERFWDGAFAAPVPDAANSAFGSRSVFNNQPRSPHGGADFASPTGRPVRAPNAGRVVLAEDLYFTGGTVVVDHGLGLVSLFAHLSSIDAIVGSMVNTGDVLGRVGATGRVTGPHLHWTVRLGGTRVDPLSLIAVSAMTRSTASTGLLP